MIVTIPACPEHEGFHKVTVTIMDQCPVCGGPRGKVYPTRSYDGSRVLHCDGWDNPCGHVDKYSAVRDEAADLRAQADAEQSREAAAEVAGGIRR